MERYNALSKVYITVKAVFYADGGLEPISFIWEDGHEYKIARIVDVRRAASLKAGGVGIRYTCKVHNQVVYIFFEEDRWFMERN
ncbi:MAG: hypothetical protein ACOX6E_07135 [Syntrophomonadaceae bacterium]|jgi:hypothetical protein